MSTRQMRLLISRILPLALLVTTLSAAAAEPPSYSGIYPHLAFFNNDRECGTGAVVPWAGRLWAITYSPHQPRGSSDKLYEITDDLRQIIRPESVGGTHANRMIHAESRQLFIGPYVIDEHGGVRVISRDVMPGRLTGTARHLTDPANKVYFATMEEGYYEVDVKSLAVRELYRDANATDEKDHGGPLLPGYHGKGLYSGQGRLIYANNGELSPQARTRPDIESGVLAEWDSKDWAVVRRNQFTDVTGPGGINGSGKPDTDPIWSIGWDHRSLILMLRDGGKWQAFRLPKASHAYDGAHGWNTEWPRIREIGEGDSLLMTMHGLFWRFPRTFSAKITAGIAPRSTYLKVIGDFCRWNDRIAFGCDDTAKSEFLNKRNAKGGIAPPGQSQSTLWFVKPDALDHFGPALGRGAVWLDEPIKVGVPSDPFLFDGFARRGVHLAHTSREPVAFQFEVDRDGHGEWTPLRSVVVPASSYQWVEFDAAERGAWVRLSVNRECPRASVLFQLTNDDTRPRKADSTFRSWAGDGTAAASYAGGLLHTRGHTLQVGSYELRPDMTLQPINDPAADEWLRKNVAIPTRVLTVDSASVLYIDDAGQRWRLPKARADYAYPGPFGVERIDREVVTERDLFNAGGIFYELPAENAGGFAKIRPVATHNRRVHDYCSWRGLLVVSGLGTSDKDDPHVVRSADGRCAVWVGAVDDLWKLGKPRGVGGPWLDTPVRKGEPSDPYLMTGFDQKRLTLSHRGNVNVTMRVEVDISGTGLWQTYGTYQVGPNQGGLTHNFPRSFGVYWLRVVADADVVATAQLEYD